ncbi:MAG: hypothetical protein B7Z40_15930 [Bosea sp. 12-68-7]|nr:MAG: hypothetical protein B7Z40_15930 [Bosea sp. 12-68-7]
MMRLTPGWVTPRSSAAREIVPAFMTATKVSIWRLFTAAVLRLVRSRGWRKANHSPRRAANPRRPRCHETVIDAAVSAAP